MPRNVRYALLQLENWYWGKEAFSRNLRWKTAGLVTHDRSLAKELGTRGFPLDNKKPAV